MALTHINKIVLFKRVIQQLTTNQSLDTTDQTYILTCAILFLKHYNADKRWTSYAEFAYYIILKYSVFYKDYLPLFDFSVSFGFYPIVKSILDNRLIDRYTLNDCLLDIEVERFRHESYIETIHQHVKKRMLLKDESDEIGYIAPTSFGKSSVIVDCIRKYELAEAKKIAVIVPTKSLLMQTYRMIRAASLGKKILIHDEMFQGESAFIAIFTQERALRLLNKFAVNFDVLFIDEAHNLLHDDSRSVLLSRLISKNRSLNPAQQVVYLSPLVENSGNLKVMADQVISEYRIPFTLKEPEIQEFKLTGQITKYNRFVNAHYEIGRDKDIFSYIANWSLSKNFLYNFRPVSIERLAQQLAASMPTINQTPALTELIRILRQEVHEKFYAVDYIVHGIVYLHGKLPDLIKEYIESKFKDLSEIKYIIANSVILEGMNLPIDNLFIMNTRGLHEKELTNLIGRVNRLNAIFTRGQNNLEKLLPPVHFVNSETYYEKGSTMTNKIELLRSRTFKDIVENPTLENFDFDKLPIQKDQKERKKNIFEKIREDESFLNRKPSNEQERLKQYLIENGIAAFYKNLDGLVDILYTRIASIKEREDWQTHEMLEKIYDLFLKDILDQVADYEFKRLGTPAARKYYNFHVTVCQGRALKQNIIYQFNYFQKRVKDQNPVFYFGETYGERPRLLTTDTPQPKTYIDLSTKSDTELINLAIVKLKMEDDFVSFKLNKFIIMMYDYKLILQDDYYQYIYGTTDRRKIELMKIGLSVSLISRLEADDQLKYLYQDDFNNLKSLPEFEVYKHNASDFYRFEIERFIN